MGQCAWRGFNLILGGVHVFLFLNVKDGPSRYRMAGFYTVTAASHEGEFIKALPKLIVLTVPEQGYLYRRGIYNAGVFITQ